MTILQNQLLRVEINESNLAVNVTDRRSGARWHTPSLRGQRFTLYKHRKAQ